MNNSTVKKYFYSLFNLVSVLMQTSSLIFFSQTIQQYLGLSTGLSLQRAITPRTTQLQVVELLLNPDWLARGKGTVPGWTEKAVK